MNWSGDIKLCDFGLTGQLINSIAKTKEIGCRPYMAVSTVCTSDRVRVYVQTDHVQYNKECAGFVRV